jgi:hypothetical protein
MASFVCNNTVAPTIVRTLSKIEECANPIFHFTGQPKFPFEGDGVGMLGGMLERVNL